MQLDSSVAAVITGGASGLGEAMARLLAAKGVQVSLFDLNAERGHAIAKEIGGQFYAVDVTFRCMAKSSESESTPFAGDIRHAVAVCRA
jgi:NADP-dependent 3-hydroxy acid dehydrogenase YdfG